MNEVDRQFLTIIGVYVVGVVVAALLAGAFKAPDDCIPAVLAWPLTMIVAAVYGIYTLGQWLVAASVKEKSR